MIRRLLLEGISQTQNGLFSERRTDHLQPDRQTRDRKPTRHRNGGEAGQVDGDGENVGEVHSQGVVGLFPDLEGCRWRGRGYEHVDAAESLLEILPNQRPYLLCLAIVCIVVSSAER